MISWMKRRYRKRVIAGEPYSITVWKPTIYEDTSVKNSYAPIGWWPFTVRIKEIPRPRWWMLELDDKPE